MPIYCLLIKNLDNTLVNVSNGPDDNPKYHTNSHSSITDLADNLLRTVKYITEHDELSEKDKKNICRLLFILTK